MLFIFNNKSYKIIAEKLQSWSEFSTLAEAQESKEREQRKRVLDLLEKKPEVIEEYQLMTKEEREAERKRLDSRALYLDRQRMKKSLYPFQRIKAI